MTTRGAVQRGQVYWHEFPAPWGKRLIIIVSRNTGRDRCLVVPILNKRPPAEHRDIVAVEWLSISEWATGFARCDQVLLMPKRLLDSDELQGTLTQADMNLIGEALGAALEL